MVRTGAKSSVLFVALGLALMSGCAGGDPAGSPLDQTREPGADPAAASVEPSVPAPESTIDAVGSAPPIQQVLNGVLIGMSVDAARDVLIDSGWTVRTDDLDEPTETFTADLRPDRVTIAHRNGLVVEIIVG